VDLFDTTSWTVPGETEFNSDKEKEKRLTARPFDASKLQQNIHTEDVSEAFRQKVREFNPGLIAFSVTEDLFPIAKYLLEALGCCDIPTIMGGVFPTFAPEMCLSLEGVDMICIGEGEDALVRLAERIEQGRGYNDIPNLWIKTERGIIRNPLGPPADIEKNPLMDFSLFEDGRLYRPMQGRIWRMLPVETHRGCPYQCTYCNSPSQVQLYRNETGCRFFRKKSFQTIHRELKYYKDDIKAEAFYFWADTFMAYSEKEFAEFCEMYQDIRLPFWCQARPEEIKESRIRKLMDLGLFRMGIGVEHGNEEFRAKILKRKMSNTAIISNLRILNNCGLKFSVNNIIGFPTETRELAMDTVKLNRSINSDSANAYSFSPFHGTPLRRMAEELGFCDPGLIARSVMRPTLLNMPQFPPEQIEGLRRCFILYVKMPEERWTEIEKAEELTPEGDKLWQSLRDECAEKYMYV
jgi:radical SAM superfamily enzyme YgiQ (UPF0313 family)